MVQVPLLFSLVHSQLSFVLSFRFVSFRCVLLRKPPWRLSGRLSLNSTCDDAWLFRHRFRRRKVEDNREQPRDVDQFSPTNALNAVLRIEGQEGQEQEGYDKSQHQGVMICMYTLSVASNSTITIYLISSLLSNYYEHQRFAPPL